LPADQKRQSDRRYPRSDRYSNFFGFLECRSAGFDDFFTKPVALKALFKAAEEAFEKLERWKVFVYDLA
jgi:CheY-like chemotaxis protein